MDRGAWWATICGVTSESDTTEQLNNNDKNKIRRHSCFSLSLSLFVLISWEKGYDVHLERDGLKTGEIREVFSVMY